MTGAKMPTSFIALQCFQCSTMQVKQQKKSSNKWNCVVCNQKQSVRKVFAQSFMAKDVRKFVQNFNMSRQLSDQKQSPSDSEDLEAFDSPKDEHKRKRNDWTEYVDDQEESNGKFNEDGDCAEGEDELVVVTEIPKAVFMKPKVKDFKPLIPKSRNAKGLDSQCELGNFDVSFGKGAEENCSDTVLMASHTSERDSKWSRLRAQIQDDCNNLAVNREKRFLHEPAKGIADKAITKEQIAPLHRISKWSSFINEEEDDGDLESRGRRGSWDHRASEQSDYQLDSLMNDERVEDDIHPDFL